MNRVRKRDLAAVYAAQSEVDPRYEDTPGEWPADWIEEDRAKQESGVRRG